MDKQKLIKDLKNLSLRTLGIFIILGSVLSLFAGFDVTILIIVLVASFLFNIFLDIIISIVRMRLK